MAGNVRRIERRGPVWLWCSVQDRGACAEPNLLGSLTAIACHCMPLIYCAAIQLQD